VCPTLSESTADHVGCGPRPRTEAAFFARIAGSNPIEGVDVCILCLLCVV
jgi:hypothetical protein